MRCSSCGRFCRPADRGIPFGGPTDLEPPDEQFWCRRCARSEELRCLKTEWVPLYWVKPRWTRKAARRLGMIEVRPVGAAWSVWMMHPKKGIPEGWEAV
jgi:hypothetical protein